MTKNNLQKLLSRMAPAAILLLMPVLGSAGTISLVPSKLTLTEGEGFQLDLIATDLHPGAYDVTFSYNPLLVGIDESLVTFDSHLGAPDNAFQFIFPDLDSLELGEVSFLTNATDLDALQADPSFPLAHIPVKALLPGIATFNFVTTAFTGVGDYAGNPVTDVTYQDASVTIASAACPPPAASEVPEAGTVFLTVSGLLLVFTGRLRRRPRPYVHVANPL